MKLGFSPEEELFRQECADWLNGQMAGEFRDIKGITKLTGSPERRKEWEQQLAEHRWSCIGWPSQWGGRDATLAQQVIFAEEYARAGVPGRVNHIGIELAGPTILTFGTEEQKQRFLPGIAGGKTIFCQGFSEPNAGSDLASVRTKARLEDGEWVVNGQKIWTSLAHISDWIFVVTRTEEGSQGPKGLTFLMMPIDQPGIEIRGIRQINGDAEFNETFFTDARCPADSLIGAVGDGWRIAMGLLAFERGVSTLGQQMGFRNELDEIIAAAKANGAANDPLIRQRLAKAEVGLRLMRYGALRMLSQTDHAKIDGAALTYKIQWASWRRSLGELAMDVLGQGGEISDHAEYEWDTLPNLFLFSRADTIYGGTNQIQRNLIAERGLGLPREPRGNA
ncbi:acyl-CoA dehydrogenase [Sphingomonadales bacterium 56]|jgi:alkylation response protein AidB-like acyl-CoA dehydrogenase|uniref:acyl-CoA dehydrogenase family protein n=1 Tax=unclassified Sphingobium TaxID=2611147 RepID=UPI00191A9080|nr:MULTISPECIES: acyl-CoA dehydrogenase family protein [unclassified Sphingobium]MBY2929705.1 acyl-CoA dehydrogenase [Sphingomonadales bacterium 56]MBY2960112.1 acyl-CoA dehydrogenase [Sphingomonadales bacterium 58]CAD7340029.1 Putative acyl-CoA dehydrogenase FadE17 [Sphingobium sp. S6]CAD7340395.1 Putative acyl-CoA dehydrogenase FadE17 [Sphingobium sp. S8]